ncbi:beta-hydroxyacyl-ACP dehydratase [Saccharothrix sp. ALI-22-I]|uniref:3-hydroxyacyl-ACP dehydratase FabZ n=1 Tax=Saccharothrix sp. ALI-22-I TaxID=1933778 RepID=UPI00097BB235|nr:3-hydroxyacyl-ACP dehydratase FabZ [Saccharothrix sp. ALI-22-I]ONI90741.1 beta-hydroxyacyl-ACP dehydratase [Saccharothrix sp. ALI-22-I]
MTATREPVGAGTSLSNDRIREILPHRWPFLLLDRVEKVEPGVGAVGVKNVAATEPWFQGHFPTAAVLPGVLVIEAMAQLAGVVLALAGAGPIGYLAGVRSMRFRRPVVPGDQLVLTADRTAGGRGFSEFKVSARVGGQVVAEGTITIADPAATSPTGKV